MKKIFAETIVPGDIIDDEFALAEKTVLQKKDGNAYLNVVLADRTGRIQGVVWDDVATIAAAAAAAAVVTLVVLRPAPTQETVGWLDAGMGVRAFAPETAKVRFAQDGSRPVLDLDQRAVLVNYRRPEGAGRPRPRRRDGGRHDRVDPRRACRPATAAAVRARTPAPSPPTRRRTRH